MFTLSRCVILKEVWIVEDPATTVINIVFLPSSPGLILIIIKLLIINNSVIRCEVSHSISTMVTEKEECSTDNSEAGCTEVIKRIEKDIVTSNENCYDKDAETCGPINCRYCNNQLISNN